MSVFHFYYPIEVRYGDLDPQGHVNNSKYLTYLEQARIAYFEHLGLWKRGSFLELGIILADVHIAYKVPIHFGQGIQVGVKFTSFGNKSMHVLQRIKNANNDQEFASAEVVLVAYSYHLEQTIPIPDLWRKSIREFEQDL